MKTYNNEDRVYEDIDLAQNWPLYAADKDRDDDLDNDDEEEEDDEGLDDWGDIDPAGGDAPSSPGSAV